MSKLIIKLGQDVVDHVEMRPGDMKLGRKAGCDIHLDNLSVSGEHANIFTIGGDSFIQDLGSTNGTYVNKKKIAKHHLKHGDIVTIGKYTLTFLTEMAEDPDTYAKTIAISGPAITTEEFFAPSKQQAPEKRPEPKSVPVAAIPVIRQAALITLSGGTPGKRIELTKSVTNLGKGGKRAVTITRLPEGFMLASGEDEIPKVNGRPVSGSGIRLRNGDIIEVAGTRLQFHVR